MVVSADGYPFLSHYKCVFRCVRKDYERSEESSESWIYVAMTHLMLRRLDPA